MGSNGNRQRDASGRFAPGNSVGRQFQPVFSSALADELLEQLADLGTMEAACAAVGITTRTLRRWRASDPAFAKRLREAEPHMADALAGQALGVVDEAVQVARGAEPRDLVQAARVAADVKLRLAAARDPRYGRGHVAAPSAPPSVKIVFQARTAEEVAIIKHRFGDSAVIVAPAALPPPEREIVADAEAVPIDEPVAAGPQEAD